MAAAKPDSASDVRVNTSVSGNEFGIPRPATENDISGIVEGFAHAAEYLEKAGFDGIELHGAHGYLISQFISPRTNKRTDQYGATRTDRFRLVFEIAESIRHRVSPSFIMRIKINAVEFHPDGGVQPEDATALCVALENARLDFVELSGPNYHKMALAEVKRTTTSVRTTSETMHSRPKSRWDKK